MTNESIPNQNQNRIAKTNRDPLRTLTYMRANLLARLPLINPVMVINRGVIVVRGRAASFVSRPY